MKMDAWGQFSFRRSFPLVIFSNRFDGNINLVSFLCYVYMLYFWKKIIFGLPKPVLY